MKITKSKNSTSKITFKTNAEKKSQEMYKWWEGATKTQVSEQLLSTAAYLKETQSWRIRSAWMYARLYGNLNLFNFAGVNMTRLDQSSGLPADRPTFNLIQSAADTLVSRISQNRPQPVFLTDGGDYKQRLLSKKLNNFIQGEFYQTKAYELASMMLRDALVDGVGVIKVFETYDHKVGLERVLSTELYTDLNEGMYGKPRQLYQLKLVDRDVLIAADPKYKTTLEKAEKAFPDNSQDSSRTVSDQILVVEGWHLPSGKGASDGRHTIACSAGIIFDEPYEKDDFPFVFLHYSSRLRGFWSQGLAEQLMGTQLEINSLLYTISRAIKLVGVPRIFIENSSKVVKAHNNNDLGVIITYTGIKPSYEVAPAVPQEMYTQLERLIRFGYQQCGVSSLDAGAQKPAGLNSGEAIRTYDDISTDRFAALSRKYDNVFLYLAYQIIDKAKDIATEQGSYQSIYPSKNGIVRIDLPKIDQDENPFVIQVYTQSSLPKDPAGRLQKITEMIQAGMLSIQEGRRLLDYPDLDQIERLENASEERIFQILDEIVEDGKYTPPDPFMNLQLANKFVVQYINLYGQAKLEEDKMQLLRDFNTQVQTLQNVAAAGMAPPVPPPGQSSPGGAPNAPQANPMPLPQSPLVPNGNPSGG